MLLVAEMLSIQGGNGGLSERWRWTGGIDHDESRAVPVRWLAGKEIVVSPLYSLFDQE